MTEQWNELINLNKPTLINFTGENCAPCKLQKPIIEQLKNKYTQITFINLDVEKYSEIASKYNIFSIPTILIFKNGEVIENIIGRATKSYIENIIKKIL